MRRWVLVWMQERRKCVSQRARWGCPQEVALPYTRSRAYEQFQRTHLVHLVCGATGREVERSDHLLAASAL